ncbi:hypothetical protein LTR66_015093, partial [Elasticomyces elasticus]
MDDTTAAEISRSRRKSMSNHDISAVSDPAIEEKAVLTEDVFVSDEPHSYPPTLELDAPPLPPMPTQEEINKRLSTRYGYTPETTPKKNAQGFLSDPIVEDDSISVREEKSKEEVAEDEQHLPVISPSEYEEKEPTLPIMPSSVATVPRHTQLPRPRQISENYEIVSEEPMDRDLSPMPTSEVPVLQHTTSARPRQLSENYELLSDEPEWNDLEQPPVPTMPSSYVDSGTFSDLLRPVYHEVTSEPSYTGPPGGPPPLPPHSPRPRSYIEDPMPTPSSDKPANHGPYTQEPDEIAPPPPSHSPRPRDITPEPRSSG